MIEERYRTKVITLYISRKNPEIDPDLADSFITGCEKMVGKHAFVAKWYGVPLVALLQAARQWGDPVFDSL